MQNRRGFTLVEMLVTIAVIMIISGFSFVVVAQARVKARDDQRIRDMKLIQTSLELYRKDIDNSTDPADANLYAYPVRTNTSDLGIYGNSRFGKYLTKTPVDPSRKTNYVYYAPACLRPAAVNGTGSVYVTPAKDQSFHTAQQIRENPVGTYCPSGYGWLPYVVFGVLEQPTAGKSRTTSLLSLSNSSQAIAHSIVKPIFATTADEGAAPTVVPGTTYCYPATGSCSDILSSPSPGTTLPPVTPSPSPTNMTTGMPAAPTTSASPSAGTTLPSPSPSPSPSGIASPVLQSPSPSPGFSPPRFP